MATYADLVTLPEEIIDGELYTSPRHSPKQLDVIAGLVSAVRSRFGRGGDLGGWHILAAPELHLADNVLSPDIAGWRFDTLPMVPVAANLDVVPDWVCVVMSNESERLHRLRKLPLYAALGVANLWLIDSDLRTLEVKRREGQFWSCISAFLEEPARAEPFDAIEIDLSLIWSAT